MKRIIWVAGLAIVVFGAVTVQPAAAQNTNNFSISNYDISYELSRDNDGRSVLKTTETITAEFPSYDQNHGIERAIPTKYDGHPTHLAVNEVSNGNGESRNYSISDSNGNSVVRIGDADSYVHGQQTYRLIYSQRDVTRLYQDTGRDEWYWDTNGTEWKVPIDNLRISAHIDESLSGVLTGQPVCYKGSAGVAGACLIAQEGAVYTTEATNLGIGENITIAAGFTKGTFAAYQQSTLERLVALWGIIQAITLPIFIGLVIVFGVIARRRKYRMAEERPIVAEYIPPKDASVMVSARVSTRSINVFSAQLIDLAVRHYIAIIETKPKSAWRSAEYDIEIMTDLATLRAEEREIISDMFGSVPAVGVRLALKSLKNNMSYATRTLDNDKKLKVLLTTSYAMFEKSPKASKLFYGWAVGLLILGVLTVSVAILFAAVVIWAYGVSLRPLSDKGLDLRRYVLGLDKYIKASETERLAFLQGPDTAQKVGYAVDANDTSQLIKLYERVLPYAILFGREKEWAQRLGDYYTQTQSAPGWYSGSSAFNGALFASALSSFSQATVYSAGSSSSSGGSSGGGFSGGGGGGGGGGGW